MVFLVVLCDIWEEKNSFSEFIPLSVSQGMQLDSGGSWENLNLALQTQEVQIILTACKCQCLTRVCL